MFRRRFSNTFITLQRSLLLVESCQVDSAKLAALCKLGFLLVVVALIASSVATAGAQDKPQENPTKPSASPSPKLGTELDGPVIVHTDLITLTVTVTDTYGRYVSGLNKNAFTVFDEKQPQEITFFSDDDAPVSVGVIFDVSGSMSGDRSSGLAKRCPSSFKPVTTQTSIS